MSDTGDRVGREGYGRIESSRPIIVFVVLPLIGNTSDLFGIC